MKDFKYEHFNTIYDFNNAIKTRAVNSDFAGKESSRLKDDSGWFGTGTWDEAQELLEKGWNVKVEQMKSELEKFSRDVDVQRRKQIKSVAGYAPCVPNAIRGVPKSMLSSKPVQRKESRRTLRIVMNNTAIGNVGADELMKSGMTMLKLALLLEKSGVKTRIDVVPKMSFSRDEKNVCYGCSVTIKDYRQPFNLSKMSYPLAHASFFRRHGFRYLETMDGDMRKWVKSYGVSLSCHDKSEQKEYLDYVGFLKDGVVYIDFKDCQNADYNPETLAEMKEIKITQGVVR